MTSRDRTRQRRGAHAIEMALVAPVLIYLTFAGMDFAWYFVAYQELQRAVHIASEVGAQAPDDLDPVEEAYASLARTFEQNAVLSPLDATAQATIVNVRFLQVDATATFEPLVGVVPVPQEIHAARCILLEN